MLAKRATVVCLALGIGVVSVGCAGDGNNIFGAQETTAAIPEKPKVDPACGLLSARIDSLRKEGIADKVEKAAIKKHKMTAAELGKAAELNKANAEFQNKCSASTAALAAPPASSAAAPATATTQVSSAAVFRPSSGSDNGE